jgi:hypothetical protein
VSARAASLSEPVLIARFWANRRGEAIFVQLRPFEGCALVDVRKHFTAADGTMQPTKKGLSIVVARLPELAAALSKAAAKAVELGLLEGEAT